MFPAVPFLTLQPLRTSRLSENKWRIHESDFLKIEITVPSVEEQRKIGAYLDQLDNLITLHQRELEKLQNIKKSMLEKMFV